MIVYHKHNEIDRVQWDNCIKNSPGVKPFAYSWYLDIMAPGWEALVDDDYDAVFPVPVFRKYGINYIATPIFLQQLGAFSPDKPSDIALNEFVNYLPDSFSLVDLCVAQRAEIYGYRITEKTNLELDLSLPYEKLRESFSKHCRRNISASSREKPELVYDIKPDEIIDVFIKNRGNEIKGIRVRDYEKLKNLMNFCLKNKKGKLVGVRSDRKKLIFGVFIVETPGNKTLLFVANTPASRKRRIGYYFVNELIRDNSSTKTILDFNGSSIPSIASFMQSFGSQTIPFYRIYKNKLLWPVSMFK